MKKFNELRKELTGSLEDHETVDNDHWRWTGGV
jgi:hypothetical protein